MINTASGEWLTIKAWADERLTKLRAELEGESVDERRADFLRGQIENLKELQALPNPKPEYNTPES